ncbi:MAG: hypothetical protein IPK63_17945 [Candidatus Competibacteraceae bacterium]|nr:hypothetical protein [Candidatus Competibacteraceae bacterium]
MNDKAVEIGQARRSGGKDIEQRRVTVPENSRKVGIFFTTAKAKRSSCLRMRFKFGVKNKIAFINKRLTKIFRAVPQKNSPVSRERKIAAGVHERRDASKENREFEHMVAPIDEKGQETVSLPDMLKKPGDRRIWTGDGALRPSWRSRTALK